MHNCDHVDGEVVITRPGGQSWCSPCWVQGRWRQGTKGVVSEWMPFCMLSEFTTITASVLVTATNPSTRAWIRSWPLQHQLSCNSIPVSLSAWQAQTILASTTTFNPFISLHLCHLNTNVHIIWCIDITMTTWASVHTHYQYCAIYTNHVNVLQIGRNGHIQAKWLSCCPHRVYVHSLICHSVRLPSSSMLSSRSLHWEWWHACFNMWWVNESNHKSSQMNIISPCFFRCSSADCWFLRDTQRIRESGMVGSDHIDH